MNYPPAHGPAPDYTTMRPYNLAARTIVDDTGARAPDRRVTTWLCGSVSAPSTDEHRPHLSIMM